MRSAGLGRSAISVPSRGASPYHPLPVWRGIGARFNSARSYLRLMSAHRELQRIKIAAATGVGLAVAAEALSAIVGKASGRNAAKSLMETTSCKNGVALELAECGPQIADQIVAILNSD